MAFGKLRSLRLGAPRGAVRVDADRAGASVYGTTQWKQLRAFILQRVRACMACGAVGRRLYVDHIKELADGGEPYLLSNLCVLCASCHARKTHAVRKVRAGIPSA